MRKKILSTIAILLITGGMISFTGCSQENDNSDITTSKSKELSSKFTTPNGDILFENEAAFISSTSKILSDTYGQESEKCIVKDIIYSDVPVGYSASIEYVAPNGQQANYIMTNIPFEYVGGELQPDEKPLKNRLKSTNNIVKLKSLAIIPIDSYKIETKINERVFVYSSSGDAVIKYNIR